MTRMTRATLVLVAATAAACGRQVDNNNAAVDTATTAIEAAPDVNAEFLTRMVDHHEGLIEMASQAMKMAAMDETRRDAQSLHDKQKTEQDSMIAMLKNSYQKTHQPMIMPRHQAMIDSLSHKNGHAYDAAFYQDVIAHHKEGIAMTDDFLARLSDPKVRAMAEKGNAEQRKQITEFEKKAKM